MSFRTPLRGEKSRFRKQNMQRKQYYVYVMTNKRRTVFYTGVTNDLIRRIWEHKERVVEGFTKKYNIEILIYFEVFDDIRDALQREKQIKDYRREKKLALIKKMNPTLKEIKI